MQLNLFDPNTCFNHRIQAGNCLIVKTMLFFLCIAIAMDERMISKSRAKGLEMREPQRGWACKAEGPGY